MAFNTGNALGSTDPRDLSDNAENLDRLSIGNESSYPDRLSNSRKSWAGMESEFNADQSARDTAFDNFLSSSGYEFLGEYAGGIEVTAYNQIIRESGEFWRAAASTSLPYTTTGAGMPEGGAFVSVGDANLRQELGSGILRANALSTLETTAGRFDGDAARLVSGTGRDGNFRWNASDLSSTLVLASVTSTSVDDTTDTITSAGHGLVDGNGVITQSAVNGLSAQTVYWVVDATTDTFQLSETFGGLAFDLTGTTNFTVDHLLDPLQGVYVTPSSDKTGASGAWVRHFQGGLNPEWTGAVGDGSTDDTAAMTAAFALSKNIEIPEKTFIINGRSLGFDTLNDASIFAKSWRAKIVRTDAGDVIKIQNCNRVTVKGLYVQGVKSFVSGTGAIQLLSCTQFLIEGNYCTGSSRQGIKVELCTDGAIIANNTTNSYQDGIMVRTGAKRVTVSGNVCWNNGDPAFSPPIGEGIHLFDAEDCTVTGNVCYDNKDHGIALEGADFCAITGNVCSSNVVSGISVNSEAGSGRTGQGTVICNNTYRANGSDGVIVTESDDLTISSNIIANNVGNGIFIGPGSTPTQSRIAIRGNNILGSGSNGILLDWNNEDCKIEGNILRGANGRGILVNRASCLRTVIKNNDVVGFPTAQITDNGTDSIIKGNQGFVTENSGTRNIPDTSTAEFVTHGLDYTPSVDEITAIVVSSSTTNPIGEIKVYNPSSTQFTLAVDNDPGAGGVDIAWAVRRI